MQVADLLLVLVHSGSEAMAHVGRRETLQALFEAMREIEAPVLALALQAVEHLTTEPAMLQPLQVCCPPTYPL